MYNRDCSKQRDEKYPTNYTHMFPAGSQNTIRSVSIYYSTDAITGFRFFDKEGALFWEIGYTKSYLEMETVIIAKNEVIVGVVAKLSPAYQSAYSDFQFQIASRYE